MKRRVLALTVIFMCVFLLTDSSSVLFAKRSSGRKKNAPAPIVQSAGDIAQPEVKTSTVLPEFKPALKSGMNGSDVELLQRRLHELGYYKGTFDGVFGNATLNAVLAFQVNNGLFVDGIVGSESIIALNLADDKIKKPPSYSGGAQDGEILVAQASKMLGTPYVWGGVSPKGFDCSGFVYYLLKNYYGITVPRMASGQFNVGMPVERANLQSGDLVFFSTYARGPSHVGVYMGNGNFIHASSAARRVTITPLNKVYYVERYLGARRLF